MSYKDKPGYSCVGKFGPPYNPSGRCDYACQFGKIKNNINSLKTGDLTPAKKKKASCHRNQATNLFNIMKKNMGAKGLSTLASVQKKVSKKNIDAYCDAIGSYHRVVPTSRSYQGKYCSL